MIPAAFTNSSIFPNHDVFNSSPYGFAGAVAANISCEPSAMPNIIMDTTDMPREKMCLYEAIQWLLHRSNSIQILTGIKSIIVQLNTEVSIQEVVQDVLHTLPKKNKLILWEKFAMSNHFSPIGCLNSENMLSAVDNIKTYVRENTEPRLTKKQKKYIEKLDLNGHIIKAILKKMLPIDSETFNFMQEKGFDFCMLNENKSFTTSFMAKHKLNTVGDFWYQIVNDMKAHCEKQLSKTGELGFLKKAVVAFCSTIFSGLTVIGSFCLYKKCADSNELGNKAERKNLNNPV